MSRKLSITGIFLTTVYALLLYFIFDGRIVESLSMKPNEIGDLLAGIFGPLAILWLILGFFQQGIELRQNTKALELQADELRSSAQQQRELVEISKAQLEASIESSVREFEERIESARPDFVLNEVSNELLRRYVEKNSRESLSALSGPRYIARFQNLGGTAKSVSIKFSEGINIHYGCKNRIAVVLQHETFEVGFDQALRKREKESYIAIVYEDVLGIQYEQAFKVA